MKYCTFFECMLPWAAAYTIPVASYILFFNITDNEKAVKKGIEYKNSESDDYDNIIPPQRYQKYANGGFPINSFAHKIYNKGNKGKFMNFLKSEASGSTLKEKLYNNFSEKRHELKMEHIFENQQDLFNDIADAFLEILEDAAEEYKNSPRNKPRKSLDGLAGVDIPKTETPSANNEVNSKANIEEPFDPQTVDNSNDGKEESAAKNSSINQTIKRRHAEKIDKIIDEIIELMKSMVHYYDSDRENESFKSNYYKYYELNSDLCGYALTYPFIESIKNIPMYLLKETDFFVFNDSNPYLVNYGKYKELLIDIRKEITALDEV